MTRNRESSGHHGSNDPEPRNSDTLNQTGEVVRTTRQTVGGLASGLLAATALIILFRQRYPRWWFDFSRELTRFAARVSACLFLLTDQYPSTVDKQSVHLEIDYTDLNRWMPLLKWLLAIPHSLFSFSFLSLLYLRRFVPGSRF